MSMRIASATLLTVCSLAAVGCNPQLKIPMAARAGQELKVTGYKAKFFGSEDDFQIGSYQVAKVDRDMTTGGGVSVGGGNGKFGHSANNTEFRYELRAQGRTLVAECAEDVVVNTVFGTSEQRVAFECTCMEGANQRSTFGYDGNAGTAHVGDHSFELKPLTKTESGLDVFPPPGYQFRGPKATGAVDKNSGTVWAPRDLGEDDMLGLICSYAGMFLYRPTAR